MSHALAAVKYINLSHVRMHVQISVCTSDLPQVGQKHTYYSSAFHPRISSSTVPHYTRAQGIPSRYTVSSAARLLESILDQNRRSVHIHSLSLSPYEHAVNVATFTIQGVSEKLYGESSQWTFPLPEGEKEKQGEEADEAQSRYHY